MATQSYEELIASATKIKNNELPESNTHDVVGDHLVQMATKAQEEYNQRVTGICEYNVSKQFPTGGIEGSNKYILELALQKVPTELRQTVGLKCSFLDDRGEPESWEYQGGTFTATGNWAKLGNNFNFFKSKIANSIIKELYVSKQINGLKIERIDREYHNSSGSIQWSIVFSDSEGRLYFTDINNNPETKNVIEFESRGITFYLVINWDRLESGTQFFVNSTAESIYTDVRYSSTIYSFLINKKVDENTDEIGNLGAQVKANATAIDNLGTQVKANATVIDNISENLIIKDSFTQEAIDTITGYYINLSGEQIASSPRKIEVFDISSQVGSYVNVKTQINGGSAISVVSVFDENDNFLQSIAAGIISGIKEIDVTFKVLSNYKYLKVSTGVSESVSVFFFLFPNYNKLIENVKKKIFFIGSSSVQRLESNAIVGEYKLDNLLENVDIIWSGVGGEDMQAVVARGAIFPLLPSQRFTIPAQRASVQINGFTLNGKICSFTGQQGNDLPKLNPVTINGIKGNIALQSSLFYFTREDEGEETEVLPTDVIVPNNIRYRGNILITMLGYNGGYDDTNDYINYHEQARKTFNSTYFLFVSRLCDGSWENIAKIKEEETALRNKYGCNAFLLRDYLSRFSISDGIKLGLLSTETDQDKNDKNNGVIPTSIRGDGVHLNEIGYKILSYKLSDTIKNVWFSA